MPAYDADPEGRRARFAAVAAARLAHVRCAVESVYHRHNASAVLRSCDATGVHRVHLVGERFHPSKGPSRGTWRWLDLRRHATAEAAVAALRAEGVALWVADLDPDARPPEEVPLDRPVCLWFGAEVLGVSEIARAAADGVVSVPMHGFAQSLNVSVAAGVALHVVADRARRTLGEAARLPAPERAALLAAWLQRDDDLLDAEAAALEAARRLSDPPAT